MTDMALKKGGGQVIEVATGEVRVAKTPNVLQCLALGSCVAVILYDKIQKIGGVAHVMLPSSINKTSHDLNTWKYADDAIYELVRQMHNLGVGKNALIARLVGGALVIPDTSDIGKENIVAVRNILSKMGIPVIDEHLGGEAGRSVSFDLETGELQINGKAIDLEAKNSGKLGKDDGEVKAGEYIPSLDEMVAERTKELNQRTQELNDVRKATLNLLQDLEQEREELIVAKAKNEATLASIGDGFAVADEKGRLVYFNKIAVEILGSDANNGLPDTWQKKYGIFDPVSMKPYPADKMPIFLAVKGQVVNKMQLFIKNKKVPEGRFIAITATPIMMNGKSMGGVAIFRDMTKEMQVDKAKTEFVSLASHQLRTPLTVIKWYMDMLLSGDAGKMTEKQKEYLEAVNKGNERMIALVGALLNVSRIEMGAFTVQTKKIDVVNVCKEIIAELKKQIVEKRLILKEEFDEIPNLDLDPNYIRIILQNLIINAIKYTPKGGRITVSIVKNKTDLLVTVKDTGYGIPENAKDKIFTKLYRADNITTRNTDGTGLGLYVTKSIVEQAANGKIWFESKENKGTTFFVSLPITGMVKREGIKGLV